MAKKAALIARDPHFSVTLISSRKSLSGRLFSVRRHLALARSRRGLPGIPPTHGTTPTSLARPSSFPDCGFSGRNAYKGHRNWGGQGAHISSMWGVHKRRGENWVLVCMVSPYGSALWEMGVSLCTRTRILVTLRHCVHLYAPWCVCVCVIEHVHCQLRVSRGVCKINQVCMFGDGLCSVSVHIGARFWKRTFAGTTVTGSQVGCARVCTGEEGSGLACEWTAEYETPYTYTLYLWITVATG